MSDCLFCKDNFSWNFFSLLLFSRGCGNRGCVYFGYFKAQESWEAFSGSVGWEWWLHPGCPQLPGCASVLPSNHGLLNCYFCRLHLTVRFFSTSPVAASWCFNYCLLNWTKLKAKIKSIKIYLMSILFRYYTHWNIEGWPWGRLLA